jgi:protein phosphatase
MESVPEIARLEVGDHVHHKDHGFARVEERHVADGRLLLALRRGSTVQQLWEGELGELRFCVPGGFFDAACRDPAAAREALRARPLDQLELFLDGVGGECSTAELVRWLTELELLPKDAARRWADRLRDRLGRGERRHKVRLDGTLYALVEDITGTEPRDFLSVRPRLRWLRWLRASESERARLLRLVAKRGEPAHLRLVLRGDTPIPKEAETALLQRVLARDHTVASALLLREHAGATAALARMAGIRSQRGFLREVVFSLPESQRQRSVLWLIEAALQGDGGDLAALFLSDQLPSGPAAALRSVEGTTAAHRLGRTVQWLQSRLSEATMDQPGAPPEPLLTQLRPLPPERLFPVSAALARALAERHATGAYGGISGARWTDRNTVELGVPEDSSPQEDVRAAMRLLAELAVGELPRGARIPNEVLLAHIADLVPAMPPEWSAVLTRALADDLHLRPWDALDLWEQLAAAEATATVRGLAPRRARLTLQLGYDTHIGLLKARGGQTNQDALFFQEDGEISLLLVADGISVATAGSGDLASALLVQVLSARWDAEAGDLAGAGAAACRDFLEMALAEANQTICEASLRLAGGDLRRHIPMGTTAVVALIHRDEVILATLGDSPAWLVGSFGAARLNGDHNVRGQWIRSWQRHEPVDLAGEGGSLVGYCGHFDEDWRPAALPPTISHVRLLPGETLLLASDGFPDFAAATAAERAAMIENALQQDDLGSGCRRLVELANAGGGGDNITVLAARVTGAALP